MYPKGAEELTVKVFEKEKIGGDDALGTVTIPIDAETNKFVEEELGYALDPTKQKAGTFNVGKAVDIVPLVAWAEKLPGKIDSYFKVFAGEKEIVKSETCDDSNTPVWEQVELWVPLNTKKLSFKVFSDKTFGDKVVAELEVDYPIKDGRYEMTSEQVKEGDDMVKGSNRL